MIRTLHRRIAMVWVLAVVSASSLPLRSADLEPRLTFSFTDRRVTLTWTADPNWALQRSASLAAGKWETLSATLGLAEFEDRRRRVPVFYRLVQFSRGEAVDQHLQLLQERLAEMVSNQIQRAVDPTAPFLGDFGETPPDDGDGGYGFDLFRRVTPYAWATQPGLIRVYTHEGSGFRRAFKLYSSPDSVASTLKDLEADLARTRAWKSLPDHFTDLNEPIPTAGELRFPIVDPRALHSGIEGFAYSDDGSLGIVADAVLPMPAEWIYVLQDGSLGTLGADNRWVGEGSATDENPITSRLAYWADDETCKLNVNVASEGIPWDLPRADTPIERRHAEHPPVRGEMQRYPGHPAMTCLSSLLYPGKAAHHPDAKKRLSDVQLKRIYSLTPRVVFREAREVPAPLDFDDDPRFATNAAWISAVEAQDRPAARHWSGFITTSNPAPEITMHGTPRMSVWPLSEPMGRLERSPYDERSAQLTTLREGKDSYHYLRSDSSGPSFEFFNRARGSNVQLYDMVMNLTYIATPGYGRSLASKYGAALDREQYADGRDSDKDHYAIALGIFDHIRTTNLLDPNVSRPFLDVSARADNGFGLVPPLDLLGRDLQPNSESTFTGAAAWYQPTLEPRGAGRTFTLSELALVAYVTSEITVESWDAGGPRFRDASGPDIEVLKRIIGNKHPAYEEWTGRRFGPDAVGKTFRSIEVGLLPELFSPTQGYPRMEPNLTLRLVNRDEDYYLGGVGLEKGLKINGIPLSLWGTAVESSPTKNGPILSTTSLESPGRSPTDLRSLGGAGGLRLFQFGSFTVSADDAGWYGQQFLANGTGPISRWSCQSLVVIDANESLTLTQEAPIQIAVYGEGPRGAFPSNVIQVFHFWFAPPGHALTVPAPLGVRPGYSDWTRRFQRAAVAGSEITDSEGGETVKGLVTSHGDYRHVAMKRWVPGQLFFHHIEALESRASHTLSWSGLGGAASAEATARQGPQTIGRSLVAGVDYAPEVLPDFVHDPANREHFAPLLSRDYDFPIDPSITRDFDNGFGSLPDGPFLNRDDGEDYLRSDPNSTAATPYFETPQNASAPQYTALSRTHHFARRLMPSPVAFGSIPSASQANAPWTCLLFRPNVSDPGRHPHLGERGNAMVMRDKLRTWDGFEVPQMVSINGDAHYPPDHHWLDYFWMPSAEPDHAASVLATQGKVNLNFQIFPYTYIRRATALHAVLKSEEILAIPTEAGPTYKTSPGNPDWRHRLDASEILKQFDERFARGEIFMTESEICELFLVPEGEVWDGSGQSMRAFWDAHRLSGDNTLERPYAGLYSRLTTRSNAFKLHFRIQTIAKGANTDPARFDATLDVITGERRGEKIIERQLDADSVPDYANREGRLDEVPRLERFYGVKSESE